MHPTEARAFPEIQSLVIGVDIERDLRRNKITKRLRQRLDEGMIDEIKGLLDEGIPAEDLIYYGLEYKYLTRYVLGELTYEEMFCGLETAIHQFAKRQMTWFRGMERRGIKTIALCSHAVRSPGTCRESAGTIPESAAESA